MKFNNRTAIILHDFIMVMIAWQASWWVRFNFDFANYFWQLSIYILPLVLLVEGFVFWRFKLYLGIWRFASLPDLWNIFRAAIFGVLCISLVLFIWIRLEDIPRSVLALYPIFLIFLLGGPRLAYRMWKDYSINIKTVIGINRVLIIGAGKAGEMLAREMLRDENYTPVGFVDDNTLLINSEVHGIRVLGAPEEIPQITQKYRIDIIVLAVPTASSEQMQKILNHCEKIKIPLRTLPKLQDMVSSKPAISELREISIEDLLGREKIELDWKIIQQGITDKIVMVSGGGGSIGSELCMQISALNPAVLIIFERSEYNLYKILKSITEAYPDIILHAILGDLCDKDKIDNILGKHLPNVIFHAAAYKHVPILQNQLREAIRNNVVGTKNLAEMAIKYDCDNFVFISTDKAVNPTNILGKSKRIGEMYCEWKNQQSNTKFITVRFGNVLDSDGSVVPLFRTQIKKGGPVTVTHPEITRFFMTIPEACQLIMQAGAMGQGGEIYVLDMGEPVKISYLAEQMIRLSGQVPGKDIDISYIGLRPGEKLFEELFYENEGKDSTCHPKILLARHLDIDWVFLSDQIKLIEQACDSFDEEKMKLILEMLVPRSEDNSQNNVIPLKKA